MRWFAWALVLFLGIAPAFGENAGEFDYYIFALSWNAGWCAIEGERKGAPQCLDNPKEGFAVHGLWPQYEEGWPSYCSSAIANPSRAETRRQAELYGSSGAAWHQWNKHGRCTGLEFSEYYSRTKALFEEYFTPEIFLEIKSPLEVEVEVIEAAMIEAHPKLDGGSIAVICKKGLLQELRLCLDKSFEPTHCLGKAARDCEYSPEILPSR